MSWNLYIVHAPCNSLGYKVQVLTSSLRNSEILTLVLNNLLFKHNRH